MRHNRADGRNVRCVRGKREYTQGVGTGATIHGNFFIWRDSARCVQHRVARPGFGYLRNCLLIDHKADNGLCIARDC